MESDTSDTVLHQVCNTRKRTWCFTYNNYNVEDITMLNEYFNNQKCDYIFQEELSASGTPHLQGAVKFVNAKKFSTLKKNFEKIRWSMCRSWGASVTYCQKGETRNGDIFTNIKIRSKVIDPLALVELYEWQRDIMKEINNPADDRSIV